MVNFTDESKQGPSGPQEDTPANNRLVMPEKPSLEEIQKKALSDEQMLALSQHGIIELADVIRDNLNFKRVGDIRVYLEVLKEMRDQAQGNIKLRQEDKLNTQIAGATKMVAHLLNGFDRRKGAAPMGDVPLENPQLTDDIPPPELVPGETRVGVEDLNPEDFIPKE